MTTKSTRLTRPALGIEKEAVNVFGKMEIEQKGAKM